MRFSPNGGPTYQVDYSGAVGAALRRLYRRAKQRGQGKQFTAAFREILASLRTKPLTVGEPLYSLPGLQLQVRTIVVAPLLLDFAVHEERRIVWIKGGKLLSGPA
jgi:hypothetical protein